MSVFGNNNNCDDSIAEGVFSDFARGVQGPPGRDGRDGKDGKDGLDGLNGSVAIYYDIFDFDGSSVDYVLPAEYRNYEDFILVVNGLILEEGLDWTYNSRNNIVTFNTVFVAQAPNAIMVPETGGSVGGGSVTSVSGGNGIIVSPNTGDVVVSIGNIDGGVWS